MSLFVLTNDYGKPPTAKDSSVPLRAIMFDFNGVIADDETPHFLAFQQALAEQKPPLFPGVVEFVKQAGERYRLAIASGGRREQLDAIFLPCYGLHSLHARQGGRTSCRASSKR